MGHCHTLAVGPLPHVSCWANCYTLASGPLPHGSCWVQCHTLAAGPLPHVSCWASVTGKNPASQTWLAAILSAPHHPFPPPPFPPPPPFSSISIPSERKTKSMTKAHMQNMMSCRFLVYIEAVSSKADNASSPTSRQLSVYCSHQSTTNNVSRVLLQQDYN